MWADMMGVILSAGKENINMFIKSSHHLAAQAGMLSQSVTGNTYNRMWEKDKTKSLYIYTLLSETDKIHFTCPIKHKNDIVKGMLNDSHLYVSAWRTWQLAWCSNWSSSHKKLWQKEQRKIRPPIREVQRVSGELKCDTDMTGWISIVVGSYHDPRHCVHTRCSLHQSEGTHRHECSDISCRGTPKLHRSHILPPCDQLKIIKKGKKIQEVFQLFLFLKPLYKNKYIEHKLKKYMYCIAGYFETCYMLFNLVSSTHWSLSCPSSYYYDYYSIIWHYTDWVFPPNHRLIFMAMVIRSWLYLHIIATLAQSTQLWQWQRVIMGTCSLVTLCILLWTLVPNTVQYISQWHITRTVSFLWCLLIVSYATAHQIYQICTVGYK